MTKKEVVAGVKFAGEEKDVQLIYQWLDDDKMGTPNKKALIFIGGEERDRFRLCDRIAKYLSPAELNNRLVLNGRGDLFQFDVLRGCAVPVVIILAANQRHSKRDDGEPFIVGEEWSTEFYEKDEMPCARVSKCRTRDGRKCYVTLYFIDGEWVFCGSTKAKKVKAEVKERVRRWRVRWKGQAHIMTIDDILSRFEGVTQTGMDSWVAMCPTHGDTQQTLLIKLKPDGRVLLHCHAGCTVEEICVAVGLKLSDLMPARPKNYWKATPRYQCQ